MVRTAPRQTTRTVALVVALLATLLSAVAPAGTATGAGSSPATVLPAVTDNLRVVLTGSLDRLGDTVEAVVDSVDGTVLSRLSVVDGVIADVPEGALPALRDAGLHVTVDAPVHVLGVDGTQDTAPEEDAAGLLGADRVWRAGYDGSGIGIAVLDTGVSPIDDLAGRVRAGVDLTPEFDGVDRFGHGTAVAAAAAGDGAASDGRWQGVAPGAHIVPVKIAAADGSSEITRLLVGLDWIARNRDAQDIDVVNLSLGSAPAAVDLVDAAVQRLWDLGLVVVVAAGNQGPGTMGTPARNTHVITVGAVQTAGTRTTSDDVAAPWTSTGRDRDGVLRPDLSAPGQSVVVAGAPGSWAYDAHPAGHLGDGYQRASGTSFSAAMVAGAAALVLDAHPDWTPDQVKGQLQEGARDVAGTHAPMPWLPSATGTDDPSAANGVATPANIGATVADVDGLLAMGPVPYDLLATDLGSGRRAYRLGTSLYGTGWYSTGFLGTGWYGTHWYGTHWYGLSFTSIGFLGTGWYGTGWYGTGWYGAGWYGTGWY